MKTKHIIIFFNVLVLLISALFPMTSHAQSSDNQRAIYIFRNDGDFNAFLNMDVDSITFSRIDLNGHEHPNVVVKEIWTPDSLYRIPLTAIDSINFNAPDPVFKSDLFHITEDHIPYVVDTAGLSIDFKTSIPTSMLPDIGQVMISDVYEGPFENGFAGRVTQIYDTNGILRVQCDTVSFKDIFDQLICVGKSISYDEEEFPNYASLRSINFQDTTDLFPLGRLSIPLSYDSIGLQLKLDISPKIVADYAVCYNVEGQQDHLKIMTHWTLDCVLDLNISPIKCERPISKEIYLPKSIRIPTKIPEVDIDVSAGCYFDIFDFFENSSFKDSLALDIGVPFKMEFDLGHDSWVRNNNNRYDIFELKSFEVQGVSGSASLNASVSCGLAFKLEPRVFKHLTLGNLKLKVGPKASGKFEADFDELYETPDVKDWYSALKDSQLKLSLCNSKLSGTILLFDTIEIVSFTWTKDWFGYTTFYLFPEFTLPDFAMPELPSLNENNGYTSATLATDVSRKVIFPLTLGIGLYDENDELKYTVYHSDYAYWITDLWRNPLTMELNNTDYEAGTYTVAPILKFLSSPIKARPRSKVKIPAERLSVDKTNIDLQQGDTVFIQLNGGWGKYALYSDPSPQHVYSATFFDNEHDVTCASWPPDTSSIYENVSPMIRIIGLNVGGATLVVKDLCSGDIETISVNGAEYKDLFVSEDSLDFGDVIVNEASEPKIITVKGVNLSGNMTATVDEEIIDQFLANTSYGLNVDTITVTFKPKNVGEYSGGITISKGGRDRYITLTGTCTPPARYITTTPQSLTFSDAPLGQIDKETLDFVVTGANLETGLILSKSGATDDFIIDPISITGAQAESGAIVHVTFDPQSAGTKEATITVSGGGAGPATVNLTGTAVIPEISVDPTSLTFNDAVLGQTYEKYITVTGTNLTSYLDLKVSGGWGSFSVDSTMISPVNAENGATVKVIYTPRMAGSEAATITISSNGAESRTVNLSGNTLIPIAVDQSSMTFENVTVHEPVTKTFKVIGSNLVNPVSLVVVGNTDEFSINPKSIDPDIALNGVDVEVTYEPSEIGTDSATILIGTQGAFPLTVNLIGNAPKPSITTRPSSLTFSDAVVGQTYTDYFIVTGDCLTSSLNLSVPNGVFSIDKSYISAANAKKGTKVTVTYKPTSAGTHTETVKIIGGGADTKTVSLLGTTLIPSISVNPSSLTFSDVTIGEKPTKTFYVKGSNLAGSVILNLIDESGVFSIDKTSLTTDQASNGVYVTVTYEPTIFGTQTATIVISTQGGSPQRVQLSGTAPKPSITVRPSSLTFSDAVVGQSYYTTFTVTGTNLSEMVYLSKPGGDFSIDRTSITPANAKNGAIVKVTYTPHSAGTQTASINIRSSGAESKKVSLSGSTVVPKITANPSSLTGFTRDYKTQTFTVTGSHLTGNLSLTSENADFRVSPTSISAAEAKNGKTVTVTFTPQSYIKAIPGRITISGGGADTVYVNLSGNGRASNNPPVTINSIEPDDLSGENDGIDTSVISHQAAVDSATVDAD